MESNQHAPTRHQVQSPAFVLMNTPSTNKFNRDNPPRSHHQAPIDSMEQMPADSKMQEMWSRTPTPNFSRPRPQTFHAASTMNGFSYCMPPQYEALPAWDSSTMPEQANPSLSQTYVVPYEVYSSSLESNTWGKRCDDGMELHMDSEMVHAYTTDENMPILDLRYSAISMDSQQQSMEMPFGNSRRMSGSSFTVSTTGGLSDMPSYEDFSASLSEAPSFCSDYPPTSNRNSLMSATQLSPVASPRMTPQNRTELVRSQSRGRASPSPRPNVRSAPYSMESTRSKRWSTGSYAPLQSRRPSPFMYQSTPETYIPPPRTGSRHSSPTMPNEHLHMSNFQNHQTHQQPFLMSGNIPSYRNSLLLPSNSYHEPRFETPPPLLSHGLFRMLQSNADPHSLHSHFTDLSDPPDLYASVHEEQILPPPEDMNPSDPDLLPHEQELRFDGDLYTPRWVRGHGNKREGWCGICKPGRWLVLKNSAFWYDKSFTHGISAATGSPFQEPQETRRMDGNPDVWEGLCGSCNDWVALVSSKKKGTTWFRHAYKCHTHPKIKDAPKRRRESSHTRALAATAATKPKTERPTTPQFTTVLSKSITPTPDAYSRPSSIVTPISNMF